MLWLKLGNVAEQLQREVLNRLGRLGLPNNGRGGDKASLFARAIRRNPSIARGAALSAFKVIGEERKIKTRQPDAIDLEIQLAQVIRTVEPMRGSTGTWAGRLRANQFHLLRYDLDFEISFNCLLELAESAAFKVATEHALRDVHDASRSRVALAIEIKTPGQEFA